MAWDSSKGSSDLISSSNWNSMVSDQKSHTSRHNAGSADAVTSIGGTATYINVNTATNTVEVYVNGQKVAEWK